MRLLSLLGMGGYDVLFLISISLVGLSRFCSASSVKKTEPDRKVDFRIDIAMPAEQPPSDEAYRCFSMKVPRAGYAIAFHPTANAERVHHMLLFGCSSPGEGEGTWQCNNGACRSGQSILYAWARNAPALNLPADVGAPIGFEGTEYIVVQVHYAHKFDGSVWDYTGVTLDMVSQEPPYISAIFLFATGGPPVPPNTATHFMNMSCSYHGDTDLYPFAFRTHTHGFGRVVSAAINRDDDWILIGARNPQWPQIFQKIDGPLPVIHRGDTLAGQCRYNSTGFMEQVNIGQHGKNEMCNFYMMFYWDAKAEDPFSNTWSGCGGSEDSELFSTYPKKAYGLLPSHPELEGAAHQGELNFGVIEKAKWTGFGSIKFGQISGLTFDLKGNLVVFHRGEKVWGSNTFDFGNRLQDKKAISADTVVTLDADSGSLISSWGANSFFMPHGITVDGKGNVWLTDVGLQQVLKYTADGQHMKLERAWGERFVPGTGKDHFCKPTAVAVLKHGGFFVADGYCNNRIVRFGSDGSYVSEFGSRTEDSSMPLGTFLLPHDIGLHEEMDHVHVADRQNGRLQAIFLNGTPSYDIKLPEDFLTVYSIDYSIPRKEFFMMPGEKPKNGAGEIKAFAASPETHLNTYSWAPKTDSFLQPHIIRVSRDGSHVYVGEIGGQGGVLWKFEIQREKLEGVGDHNHQGTIKGPSRGHQGTDASDSSSKPGESTDFFSLEPKKSGSVLLVLAVAVLVPVLLIVLLCVCLRFRKQGGFRAANILNNSSYRNGKSSNGAYRSHKGFQRLRTEDIDAVDDLTEESENEDLLYSATPRKDPKRT